MKKNLLASINWNIVDFATSLILVLLINKIVVYYIGVKGYGIYSIAFLVSGTIALLDFGISNCLTKYTAGESDPKVVSEYYSATTLLSFSIFFLFSVVTFFMMGEIEKISSIYTSYSRTIAILIVINILLTLLSQNINALCVARNDWKTVVTGNLVFKISNFIVVFIICFYKETDLVYFVFSFFFANLFRILYLILSMMIKEELVRVKKPSVVYISKIFNFVRYSFINSISGFAYNQLDKILVVKYLGVIELGYYSFVCQLINFTYSFSGALAKVKLPIMSCLHNEKRVGELILLANKLLLLTAGLFLLFSVTVYSLWLPMVSLYIDSTYADESYSITIFALIYLVVRSLEVNSFYLCSSIAKLKGFAISTTVIAFSFFLISPYLIPLYGSSGILVFKSILGLLLYGFVYFSIISRLKNKHE
ncbi:TPA: oligosaccharide flippase family protein [Vibrio cholerae]